MMNAAAGIFLAARRKPRLPYDAEVEYLESTGTPWIDTGAYGSLRTKVDVEVEVLNSSGHYAVCGDLSGSSRQITIPINLIEGSGLYSRFGDKYIVGNAMGFAAGKYRIVSDKTGITANGVSRGTFGATTEFTTAGTLYLFAFNGLARNYLVGRMMFCKIYDGVTLVRDMIPVRFTNELGQSEGAMYDRVNPTVGMNPDGTARTDGLYRNRGTGAFLWAEKSA